ncbi:MAG: transglutaminase domain-containing protein [Bacteroidaceae bacterium]|nr:transglutaminase domain-containing protein [Bacteroidaceae bacterium]
MLNNGRKLLQGALVVGLFAFICALTACTDREEAEVQDALDFLYAGMPLPDSVDYSREFWEANVKVALKARHEMPWGEKVPGREWRHFVLPLRVNNEDLDSFRIVYYDELKERVKGKTMYAAVLEVNHWCHEHVSYQPSDSRTSSPMNTLRSAIGRCGEESTFTVTALRTIGIPARQVYTPRWAHTDDNHAWVEAWVDGTWYFLGACEPEPLLNLAWFNEPASRGMLMHTKAFGDYTGPEEVMNKTACYTEINVTKNYVDVATIIVTVLGQDSLPVEGATVDYRLYNYAELYPIATKQSDVKGKSSLTCGKGDLVVWASKDGKFGFKKVSVGKDALATIVLDKDSTYTASLELDLMPPFGKDNKPEVSVEAKRTNQKRLAEEDSIRIAYMKQAFCQNAEPNSPEALARANWRTIEAFKKQTDKQLADEILATLSKKDYRDVTMDVLMDVAETLSDSPEVEGSRRYVLCPRVANERLTPYRKTLSEYFKGMSAEELLQWVKDSITVDDTRNPQHLCMSPLGVFRHRTCDAHSRDIFFVAAARSIGIPACIDEVTGKVQYRTPQPPLGGDMGSWVDVSLLLKELPLKGDGGAGGSAEQALLRLSYTDQAVKENPSYYSHFALSRIENGRPKLLEFPENATWKDTFADGVQVDAGQYMLLSGTRLANGGVWANLNIFNVAAQKQQAEPLRLRADEEHLHVIGNFDCENYFTNAKGIHKKILETTGRGFYILALIRSNHEPSTHLLHDMEAANIHFSQWSQCYLMLFPSKEDYANFDRKDFDDLPGNVLFGVADPETIEAMHIEELTHGNQELPILMLCDTFNRVVWFRQGYNIGLADQLMDALRKVILGE